MKLLSSNGKTLSVRDCGDVIVEYDAPEAGMVPFHGRSVVDDDTARRRVSQALAAGCRRVPVDRG